jgi:hypothetical protein
MVQVHITYWTTVNRKREKADYYSNCEDMDEAIKDATNFIDRHEPHDIVAVHYNRK